MTSDGKGNQGSDDEEDPFRDIEANTSTSVMEELVASKPSKDFNNERLASCNNGNFELLLKKLLHRAPETGH